MKRNLLIPGLVLALTTLGVVGIPTTAYADSTCYTGCTTTVTGNPTAATTGSQPLVTAPIAPKAATSAKGLAFTGADIGGLVIVGSGALVVGGVLVRRSRRRRRAAA